MTTVYEMSSMRDSQINIEFSFRFSELHSIQVVFKPNIVCTLTSFTLCCSLLHMNVPNRQLYMWSRMVTRKYSLNSKAAGN